MVRRTRERFLYLLILVYDSVKFDNRENPPKRQDDCYLLCELERKTGNDLEI